jgi:hypothetical protein
MFTINFLTSDKPPKLTFVSNFNNKLGILNSSKQKQLLCIKFHGSKSSNFGIPGDFLNVLKLVGKSLQIILTL